MNSFSKIFGWILLMTGLAIILWSLYSSYNIFTGKEKAPEIFPSETKKNENAIKKGGSISQTDLQKGLEKMISEQLKEMLPANNIPKILNLISWSILASILIFGGSQIGALGIKMIKS